MILIILVSRILSSAVLQCLNEVTALAAVAPFALPVVSVLLVKPNFFPDARMMQPFLAIPENWEQVANTPCLVQTLLEQQRLQHAHV